MLNKTAVTFNVNCSGVPRPGRGYQKLDRKIAFSWEVCLLPACDEPQRQGGNDIPLKHHESQAITLFSVLAAEVSAQSLCTTQCLPRRSYKEAAASPSYTSFWMCSSLTIIPQDSPFPHSANIRSTTHVVLRVAK